MKCVYKFASCLILAALFASRLIASPDLNSNLQQRAPLAFIENKGQVTDQDHQLRPDIQFQLKATGGLNIFIGAGAIHYQFSKPVNLVTPSQKDILKPGFQFEDVTYTMDRMDVELIGANKNAAVITEEKLDFVEHLYTEFTLKQNGVTALACKKITYKNIYPNIDWVFYIKNSRLEHEFVIHQGGKVSDIQLKYGGTKELKINADGSLTATTPQGAIAEHAPATYQLDGTEVSSKFELHGDVLSYSTGIYDGDLVIDPSLIWATYFGGGGNDDVNGMALDASGNVYIGGTTTSTTGIATSGAFQTTYGGGPYGGFLAKFNAAGTIQWATYYDGTGYDAFNGVSVDASGNVYAGGFSTSFGMGTSGTYQPSLSGYANCLLVKFNSSGVRQWATYYGNNDDLAQNIVADGSGNVYMSAYVASASGMATSGAYHSSNSGGWDAVVAKFNNAGGLTWGTYFGGSGDDFGQSIAIDGSGNVYLGGATSSSTGIASSGAFQTTYGGGQDAFVAKFNGSGAFQWATYYGGSGSENASGLATDPSGNVYLGSSTQSPSGIASSGAYQTSLLGAQNGYLAKFDGTGVRQWGTYIGGTGSDAISQLTSDASGNIYAGGNASSTSGIATSGAFQTTYGGGSSDGFFAQFNTSGSLLYSTYYGGSGSDGVTRAIYDGTNVYFSGNTQSPSGIATSGAYQTTWAGGDDAYIAKFNFCSLPVVAVVTGPVTVCPGGTITLSDGTAGGTWSSSNTSLATVGTSGVVTGVAAGNVLISYSVTNSCGTSNSVALITVGSEVINTIAGNGTAGYTGDGGSATAAELNLPSGITQDASGNIYVADWNNNVIRKINTSGTITTVAGTGAIGYTGDGGPATAATFHNPVAIIFNASGELIIADYNNNVIRKISTSGIISTIAGNGIPGYSADEIPATNSELHSPEGLALDAAGNLYIADGNNSRIRKVDVSGTIHTYAGTGGYTFSGDGGPATAAQMMNPFGLFMDPSGNLYLCDQLSNRIRVINTAGIISTVAGSGAFGGGTGSYSGDGAAATAATMNDPTGVYLDRAGNIYIADRGNSRVRCVNKATGLISTIAGSATAGFSGDGGSATAAKLNSDAFIYLDANANIYISDYNNNRIRKIAPVSLPIVSSTATLCQGVAVLMTDSTSGGTWTSSNSAVASVGTGIGVVTGVAAGTATISYTVNFSCGSTYVLEPVTVNAFSAGTISGPTIVCPGNTITLTDATPGGSWSSSNPAAGTVSGGVVTGIAAGNTTISYTIANSCGTLAARQQVVVGVPLISTFAGTGTAGSTGDGGQATSATFSNVHNMFVDPSGNTYVVDNGNKKIRMISPGGIVSTIAGTGAAGYSGDGFAATNATMQAPFDVVVDAAGNVIFSDYFNNRVRKVNTSGIVTTLVGNGTGGFLGDGGPATAAEVNGPSGLSLDGAGNLYIGDLLNQRVRKVTPAGIITTIAGTGGTGASGDGGPATLALFHNPNFVHADAAGNVYVVDNGNNKLRLVSNLGVVTTIAGTGVSGALGDGGAATAAQLSFPGGVAIDGAGNIYIAGDGNQKIRVINAATGIINTFAGTGVAGYSGDGGPASGAKLNVPVGVAFDNSGNLLIAEQSNNVVRKIAPVNATVASVTGSNTVCVGSTTNLADATGGGTWSSSAPAIASVGSTGIVTGVTAGTATISYSVVFACGTLTSVLPVTVNPLPAVPAAITGATSVCLGASTTLNDATPGGSWSSSLPAIATIGTGGNLSAISLGVTVISYTISNSCGLNAAFRNDTVVLAPGPISGSASVCAGLTSLLGNSAGGGVWTSSNPAVATIGSASGLVTGIIPGNTTIVYTVSGICTASVVVTVNPSPALITPAGAVSFCVGSSATLGDVTAGGTWSSSNASVATVGTGGVVTGLAPGADTISYTLAAGCASTKVVTVLVTPSALSPASAVVCTGNTTTFTETVAGGTWSTTAPAVASVAGGVVTGLTAGLASVSYTIGTCAVGAPVTVNLSPNAGVIIGPSVVCTGTPVSYINPASGGSWSSSNPAIATIDPSGNLTGIVPGTVTISYVVTNSCGTATATKIITVSAAANAGTIIGTTLVCAGGVTTLIDTTSGGVWSASNAHATISGTGVLVGVVPGIDTITYSVTNTCGLATTTHIVTVGLFLTAGTISGPGSVCTGSTIVLTDATTGGVWSSTNASASVSGGTVTGLVAGTDTIKYTVTSGCGAVFAEQIVVVNPAPFAGSITGPTILCAGFTATYLDTASGGAWAVTNANATITGAGLLTAMAAGNDTISYTVSNSCGTAVALAYVTMGPSISAGSISGSGNVCVGSSITLTDPVPGGVWNSSNASATVMGGMVTGLSAGVDTIAYTVTSSCGSVSARMPVTVSTLPSAGTVSGPASLCLGTSWTYTDGIAGGTWSTSNGNASVDPTGLVITLLPGADTIGYSVTGVCGTTTATEVIAIVLPAFAGVISGPADICIGSSATLTGTTPGGVWSASNSNASIVGGVATGIAAGLDTLSYTFTNTCGTDVATFIVNISATPAPGVIAGPSAVCLGSLITLSDTATGGAWSASNTSATISTSGLVTGITPGLDTISYTITNACGSFAATHSVTVSTTPPTAGTISGPSVVCAGSAIMLTDATPGGVWSASNVNATVSAGIVTGVAPGIDTISYLVSNGCGSATATAIVTVGAALVTGVISGPSAVCTGTSIALTDTAPGGAWSSSNGHANVVSGVVTGVSAGVDTVFYTVSGACGSAAASRVVTVSVAPVAGTISGASGLCAGATITLVDAAPGGIWSAANAHATVSGGLVTGINTGTDTIRYTVTNSCGSAMAQHVVAINGAPSAGVISGASDLCPDATLLLTHTVSGGTWSCSNTSVATVDGTGLVTGLIPGSATISYTVTNSCGHASASHVVNVLTPDVCGGTGVAGSGKIQADVLSVVPNPNNGSFTVNLGSDINESVHVVITNVIGEKVKEFNTVTNKTTEVRLGTAAGIYLLSATTDNGMHVARVIINN